jgi:hypothetical protein
MGHNERSQDGPKDPDPDPEPEPAAKPKDARPPLMVRGRIDSEAQSQANQHTITTTTK